MPTPSTLPDPFPPAQYGVWQPGGHIRQPAIPPDSPTIGMKLNHLCLRIRDPRSSLHFYCDLMGMRVVFNMNVGPYTIYYLGHPQTAAQRADHEVFARETAPQLVHTLGLLELYHMHGTESDDAFPGYSNGNVPPNLGLSHFGFSVPGDLRDTVERLRGEGVEMVKELGVCDRKSVPISEWEEQRGYAVGEEISEGFAKIFKQMAFVKDPDGYVIELVPQNMEN